MQKSPESLDLSIVEFSKKGYGVGFSPTGREFEVAHAVAGDTVRIEWRKKRRSPQKGRLLEVVAPSQDRVAARCAHAGICGGCCWQQMSYEAQLQEKMRRTIRQYRGG